MNKEKRKKRVIKTIFQIANLILSIFAIAFIIANLTESIEPVTAASGEMPVLQEPKIITRDVMVCPQTGLGRAVPDVADLNNDGKKDLIVGSTKGGKILFFKNTGTDAEPIFTESENVKVRREVKNFYGQTEEEIVNLIAGISCVNTAYPFVVDWNNDGKKDLVIGVESGYVLLYTNIGTDSSPLFESVGMLNRLTVGGEDIKVNREATPCVTDWNNDGKKDLLVGNAEGTVYLFLDTGTDSSPVLSSGSLLQAGGEILKAEQAAPMMAYPGGYGGGRSSPRHVDWDRDGVKDLLVGSGSGKIFFYKNIGTNKEPILASGVALKSEGKDISFLLGAQPGMTVTRIDVVDWNNDGGLDIVVGTTSAVYLIESIPDEGVEYETPEPISQEPEIPLISGGVISCCPETNNGAICQEILSETCNNECKENCIPSKCSQTSQCKLGCCIDDEGICSVNSPKQICEQGGGTWQDNADCNLAECQLGCCVLGDQASFVTEQRCKKLSELYGLELDYRAGIRNEIQCLALSHNQERGACVFKQTDGDFCKITTKQECITLTSIADNFYSGYLCSHPDIALCEKQVKKGCAEGKEEVYWFDSCGNTENIYSADKNASWNNGFILDKEESCNPGQSNANSKDCGNCNYFLGSKCSLENGDYICKGSDCKNVPYLVDGAGKIIKTKDRQNGESWCVYDGKIGEGDDVAGSRYFKYFCLDGEVKIEPCADYRNEICTEQDVDIEGETFSTAACRINKWQECLFGEGCGKTSDCFEMSLKIGDAEETSVCLPSYPEGFDITTEEGGEVAESICSMGNINCTVIYVKKLFKGWDCVQNCDCEKKEFTQQMNNLCKSLGDCGAYVNYLGVVTTGGYSVVNAPALSGCACDSYTKNAEPVEGQKVEPDIQANELFLGSEESTTGELPDLTHSEYEPKDYTTTVGAFGAIAGAGYLTVKLAHGFAPFISQEAFFFPELAPTFAHPSWAAFGNAMGAAGIGAVVGMVFAELFGLKGEAALALSAAGAAAALTVVLAAKGPTTLATLFGPLGLIVLAVVIIFALLLKALGIGKTKEILVEFKCKPWHPPTGGADCEKCNNPLKPCSKYRCISAGQSCQFINEGTDHELCIAGGQDDVSPPQISPLKSYLTIGFNYEEFDRGVKIRSGGERKK